MSSVDAKTFDARVKSLREHLPAGVDGVVLVRGKHDETMPGYLTTFSLQVFLTQSEMGNTIILITKDKVLIAGGKGPISKTLSNLKASAQTTLHLTNSKTDTSGEVFDELVKAMEGKQIGVCKEDLPLMKSPFFAEKFIDRIKVLGTPDITEAMNTMLRVKNAEELENHRKAAAFATNLMQRGVVKELSSSMEDEDSLPHTDVVEKIENWIESPGDLKGFTGDEQVFATWDPVIQSGDFPADFPGKSGEGKIEMLNISSTFGIRWGQYCALVGRTFLVNPSPALAAVYEALLKARQTLLAGMKPGNKVSDVCKQTADSLPANLKTGLHPTLGFGTGVHWKDDALTLQATSTGVFDEGNVLVSRLYLRVTPEQLSAVQAELDAAELAEKEKKEADAPKKEGDEAEKKDGDAQMKDAETGKPADAKKKKKEVEKKSVVLVLVDTIACGPGEKSEVLTEGAKVDSKHAIWEEEDEDEEEDESEESVQEAEPVNTKSSMWGTRQKEILLANREAYRKMSAAQKKARSKPEDHSLIGQLAKGNIAGLPERNYKSNKLEIDTSNQFIFAPIYGKQIPIHIACVSSVKTEKSGSAFIHKLMFKTTTLEHYKTHPDLGWIRELSFKSHDEYKLEMANIKTIMSMIKKRDLSGKEEAVVEQNGLQKTTTASIPKLKKVNARIKGKAKPTGDFEAHENGFRFISPAIGKPVDILYSNVKHMIACPYTPKHERSAAVHLRLHSPIEVMKTRLKDFQVWTEVLDTGDNFDTRKSDKEEELDDERQQRIIDAINKEFVRFVKVMAGKLPRGSIEIPFPDGYFEGLAGSDLGAISSTQKTLCSVLDTTGFFVLTMQDVEVAVFERVVQGQINFDAVFVMKDYRSPVQTITNIPQIYLNKIKDMMCNVYNTKYYECPEGNNWREIMKQVVAGSENGEWEPWEEGNGWESMLNPDASTEGSDDEESASSESAYEPSSSSSGDDDYDDDTTGSSDDSSDSSSGGKAKKKKRKADSSDSEDEPKKKKSRK